MPWEWIEPPEVWKKDDQPEEDEDWLYEMVRDQKMLDEDEYRRRNRENN